MLRSIAFVCFVGIIAARAFIAGMDHARGLPVDTENAIWATVAILFLAALWAAWFADGRARERKRIAAYLRKYSATARRLSIDADDEHERRYVARIVGLIASDLAADKLPPVGFKGD